MVRILGGGLGNGYGGAGRRMEACLCSLSLIRFFLEYYLLWA